MNTSKKLGGPRHHHLQTGFRCNHLVVIGETESIRYSNGRVKRRYLCQCDCGRKVAVLLERLLNGKAKSCGHERARKIRNCPYCNKKFQDSLSVNRHIAAFHRNEGNQYICTSCGKHFMGKRIKLGRYVRCPDCKQKRPHALETLNSIKQLSKRTITKVLSRAKAECIICGWNKATCDIHHIKPKKFGGSDKNDNLVIVCPNCHREIHAGVCEKDESFLKQHSVATQWERLKSYYHPSN